MNIASIDIGSNTVLLLIASVNGTKLTPLVNEYHSPRLGKGLITGSSIKEDRIVHLIQILKSYKSLIKLHNCEQIIITATNAMRIAKNASFIIEKVKKELDLNIIVIEGSEEARLSFLGASSSLPDENELIAVDIGGGSTEIIYGKNNIIQFKHSFQTGVVSLSEKYLFEFPYSKNALKEVNEFLSDTFTLAEKHVPKGIPTIAVAGTPTTLSCIKQNLKQYDEILVERSFLDSNDFDSLSNILENLDGKSIKEQFGEVVYGREDVLFSGLLILNYLKNLFNLNKIIVSGRGLRYGNIIDYMNNFKL